MFFFLIYFLVFYFYLKDLLVTLSTLLRGSVYERLRWTFKLYDLNGDGCISRGELDEVVKAIHELMGRRPHQPEDDRKARDQVFIIFCSFCVFVDVEYIIYDIYHGQENI